MNFPTSNSLSFFSPLVSRFNACSGFKISNATQVNNLNAYLVPFAILVGFLMGIAKGASVVVVGLILD